MRGKKAKVRIMQPDIKYGSDLVTKFIKKIMLDGKKTQFPGEISKSCLSS